MKIEEIARVCHEANRAICEGFGDGMKQVSWEDTPRKIQFSTVDGVCFLREYPSATPADVHQNWIEYKRDQGWSRGDIKDTDQKLHPDMVPYKDLPVGARVKGLVFIAIARALLAAD